MYKSKCQRCGAEVPQGSSFCPNCGARVANTPPPTDSGNAQVSPSFYANDPFATGPEGISRGLAVLLAIFGGGFGIQYFYTRKITAGIIMLIISLVSCTSIGYILGIVQGIYMFTLTNEQFRRTYVTTNSTFPLF